MPRKPAAPAALALAALALIWGYNWVVMKQVLRFSGPFTFAALRAVLGALALFAVLWATRRPLRPQHLSGTLILGLLQTTGFLGFVIMALVHGGAGKTAVLAYTMPLWLLVLAWPLLGERIRGVQWLAIPLAFAGLVMILQPWRFHAHTASAVLAILGGVSWALSAIWAKHLRRRAQLDLLSLTAWQMLLGAVPLVLMAWWREP
ncbi:MAG: DMT family transporter, partial [Gammaproteobacteria bacterium]